jgi:hypothetical protein
VPGNQNPLVPGLNIASPAEDCQMSTTDERVEVLKTALYAIGVYRDHGRDYGELVDAEAAINQEDLPGLESRLVDSLLGTDNPATNKPHSVSSAEAAIKTHPLVLEMKSHLRAIVKQKNEAYTQATAARLEAMARIAFLSALPEPELAS